MDDTYEVEAIKVNLLIGGVKVISPHGSTLTIELGLSQLVAVENIQPHEQQDPRFKALFESLRELAENTLRRADTLAEKAVQYELELPKPEDDDVEIPAFLRR